MMNDSRFDRDHFEAVLADFVEDNPLACHGILSVVRLVFTAEVPTLAVTLRDDPPQLLVNPDFVHAHAKTEEDLRALLLHEFLHVLLGHTKLFKKCDPVTNLALDAVINHIVQRELGEQAGEFFRRFYQPASDDDPIWLLRPAAPGDIRPASIGNEIAFSYVGHGRELSPQMSRVFDIHKIRDGLGSAKVLADDVLDLLDSLNITLSGEVQFLGGHHDRDDIHPANHARLGQLVKQLDGDGVFRRPSDFGFGPPPAAAEWAADDPHRKWRSLTMKVLRRLLVPDPRSQPLLDGVISYGLPVATSRDRRAALRSLWSPILPEFEWTADRLMPRGRANVYLDVSGSMGDELNRLTGLLWRLRAWIRSPFFAFSNGVSAARIVNGKLQTSTTGGTCFNDVLKHILDKRPGKSLIVTDGYIERPNRRLLKQLRALGEEIHVLVSADGSREVFETHSIPCTTLPQVQQRTNNRS